MDIQELGRYQLGEILAADEISTLYTVANLPHLTIRVYAAFLDEDASYKSRFHSILERTAQLHHPHILRLHDYGMERDLSYLVAPRLAQPLSLIPPASLDLAQKLTILEQIAAALDTAHSQGLAHGRLNLDSIWLDEDNHAYLTNFGMGDLLQETYHLLGQKRPINTPAFTAPESHQRTSNSPASDRYALAVLAYYLLSGHYPFGKEAPHSPLTPITHHKPQLPATLDPIFQKSLHPSSPAPYPDAQTFINAIKTALVAQLPTQMDTPGPQAPLSIPRPLRTPLWFIRRLGCSLMVVIWLLLMASPCLFVTVLVRGEATYNFSDKPGHQIRLFRVQSDTALGFGLSLGTLKNEKDGDFCVLTQVRYLLIEGETENVNYCQCYDDNGPNAAIVNAQCQIIEK